VKSALYCRGENLPHWIAVTGMEDNFLHFDNPLYIDPQKRKFKLSSIQKVIGYKGSQPLV